MLSYQVDYLIGGDPALLLRNVYESQIGPLGTSPWSEDTVPYIRLVRNIPYHSWESIIMPVQEGLTTFWHEHRSDLTMTSLGGCPLVMVRGMRGDLHGQHGWFTTRSLALAQGLHRHLMRHLRPHHPDMPYQMLEDQVIVPGSGHEDQAPPKFNLNTVDLELSSGFFSSVFPLAIMLPFGTIRVRLGVHDADRAPQGRYRVTAQEIEVLPR